MRPERWIPLLCLGLTTLTIVQGVLVGTALPQIVEEFSVDYGLMGLLMGFWTLLMAVAPLAFGRLVERGDPFKVIFTILSISSFSTLWTAAARDLLTLNLSRVLASLFAAPFVWPMCGRMVAAYVRGSRTGYAVATFNAGSMIGLAGSYLIMWLVGNSWRAAMVVSGMLGFAYAPTLLFAARLITRAGEPDSGSLPLSRIEGESRGDSSWVRKASLLLFAGHFAALYTWGLLVSWLSTYLVAELQLSYGDIAVYMAAVALASTLLEILVGAYTDKLGGLRWRILVLFAGLWPSSLLLLAALLASSPVLAALLISFSLLCWRVSSTSFWSVLNDITPGEHYGLVSRVFVSAAPLAGITSSVINGLIVSATGSLKAGILLSALVQLSSPVLFKASADLALRCRLEAGSSW